MSAHHRGLTLRATLVALVLGASLYVATICGIIAYQIAPRAADIQKQSTRLHVEFETSSERASALRAAIAEIRHLSTTEVAPGAMESLRAKIQSQIDSAGAVQTIGSLSGISGEMRVSLGQAANAESQLGALLIEALAEMELGRRAETEMKLARCDSLQTIIAGHLSEAQRLGFTDLIGREKSLGEAADSAIKMVLWWAAIGAALIPAFALLVQHRFYRPMAELDRGLARVAEGDIEARVEISREDELGRLSQHFNRMTDVLRQRAEEERRRAHNLTERFGRILDESINEIYIFDAATYHFLQVNRGARENLGYTEEEFFALTPLDLMPEFDRASFDELAALLRAGQREMAMITTVHRRRDGTTYPVEINIQISRLETPSVMVSIVRDITERRQMEEALRESEERFRLAIDAAQMGTWDWNLVTGKVRRSSRAYHLLGATEQMIGDSAEAFFDRVHPLDRQSIRSSLERAISEGAPYSEEFRVLMPDGQTCWRAGQAKIFRDESGQPARMVGVLLDITERKRAEEALRLSEEKFAKAFRSCPNPISIATLGEGRIVDVNEAFLRYFGGAREELIGRTAKEIAIWVSPLAHKETVRTLIRDREARDIEAEFRMKDGSKRTFICSAEVIELEGEECALFQSSDITGRKQIEEALRQSESLFRTLTETITMAIYIYRGNRYLYVNTAAERITGYSRDELLAMDFLALVYDEDRDRLIDYVQRRRRGEQAPTRYEIRFVNKSGEVRWIDVTVAQIEYTGEPAYLVTAIDITERKQAEAALRESQQLLSSITRNITEAIYRSTPDKGLVYVNESFVRMFGYESVEEMLETPSSALYVDAQRRDQLKDVITREGNFINQEILFRRRDGSHFWGLNSAIAIYDDEGQILYYDGAIWDITERKRAEAALRESEERFFRAFNASPMSMGINRLSDGAYIDANEAALRESGFSREELIGKTPEEVGIWIDPEDRQRMAALMQKEGRIREFEIRHRRKSGEERVSLLSADIIETGGERCLLTTAFDITERKRAEKELRESEERFSKAFQASPLSMTIAALSDGCIIAANESFLQTNGFDREEVIGHTAEELGLWIDPGERETFMRRLAEQGEAREAEVRTRTRSGEERIVLLSGVIVELGGEPCALFTGSDITERKRAEEEIQRLNEELEHRVAERTAQLEAVNRELEAFSYSVSHDLRAPLRSINGFSLALMEDCAAQLDENAMDYLSRVRAASQRMGRLIDDLLNLSRITRSDMRRERVDLSALAHSVVTDLHTTDSGREAQFRIAPSLSAEADPRLVHIALENLLGNSWKFTEKKERAEIEFGCARLDGETVYFVRDNGAGFDMAYADKLFGAFQRLHPMAEFKGTGIGLATVQRIIHRHGGRIWAEGEVGRGATFYFTLP
jgi:PAS domain S-box-containing protein